MQSDVVIVAHNSGPLLQEAVTSAVDQAGAAHVWVMDAESNDGSVTALWEVKNAAEPAIHVLSVPNTGFSAANNRAIEATDSPFILLLNPDAALGPGALAALEGAARANPRTGIVGALVLNQDGSVQAGSFGRFPSLASVVRLHLRRIGQRSLGNRALSPKVPPTARRVDWVTGAAMLVRRSAIAEVGPLDEGFFLYYEDVDWCRRMHARGWEVLLEPAARAVHHMGASDTPQTVVTRAYRESFYRYCDLYGLWGLKAVSRVGLGLRGLLTGGA